MPTEWLTRLAKTDAKSFALRRCRGVLHMPAEGASTVVVACHFSHDFSDHYIAEPLSERGYAFLGWNTRFVGADEFFRPDQALADIAMAIGEMRERFDNVVLLGNSGGGSLMSTYQSEAVGPSLFGQLSDIYGAIDPWFADMQPADAYIALNAHESRPKILTEWFDPSVTDETDPLSVDLGLSLWGSNAGNPPFAQDFVETYRAAQRARNEKITAWVNDEQERLAMENASDRVFSVYRTWADPRYLDMTIDSSDREPGCYLSTDVRAANYGAYGLARCVSLRTWLSMWSLDYDLLSTEKHLPRVTVPSLVVQGTADKGVYPSNAKGLHAHLGASDKTLVWVENGAHYFNTHPDHIDQVADTIAAWLDERGY